MPLAVLAPGRLGFAFSNVTHSVHSALREIYDSDFIMNAGVLVSPHRLNDLRSDYSDVIETKADHERVGKMLQTLAIESAIHVFSSGAPTDSDDVPPAVIQLFNTTIHPGIWAHEDIVNEQMSTLFFYSGHGLGEDDGWMNNSGLCCVPRIFSFNDFRTAREENWNVPVGTGDWYLHSLGFLGLRFIWQLLKKYLEKNKNIKHKELVIVSDACYSGHWCEELKVCYFLTLFLPKRRLFSLRYAFILTESRFSTKRMSCEHSGKCALQSIPRNVHPCVVRPSRRKQSNSLDI